MTDINVYPIYEPVWTHSKTQGWKGPRPKTDEELFAEMKKLENWENYAYPEHWYEKFNIPKPEAVDTTTYLKEDKWKKAMVAGGKKITIIKEPQEWAENTPRGFVETEPMEMKVVTTQGNYSDEKPILARELVTIQSAACNLQDSSEDSAIRPREDSTINNQPLSDLS